LDPGFEGKTVCGDDEHWCSICSLYIDDVSSDAMSCKKVVRKIKSSGCIFLVAEQKRRRRQRRRRRRRRISGFNNCIAIFSAPLAVETVEVVRYDACK